MSRGGGGGGGGGALAACTNEANRPRRLVSV